MERVNDLFLLVGRLLDGVAVSDGRHSPRSTGLWGSLRTVPRQAGGALSRDTWRVVAVAIEVLGPIALILGVFPRISALLLIAFVIAATGLAHRFWEYPDAQQANQMNHFLKNIAVIGGLLFYYVAGAGAWALGGRGEHAGAGVHARA